MLIFTDNKSNNIIIADNVFNNKSTNLSDKTNHYIDNYWLLIIALLISPIIEEKLFREYLLEESIDETY